MATSNKTLVQPNSYNSPAVRLKVAKSRHLLKEPRRTPAKLPTISKKRFVEDILREARILGLHRGAAELIAEKVYAEMRVWLDTRGAVTKADLDREVAKKVKKYHPDLSYLYENRGKIV